MTTAAIIADIDAKVSQGLISAVIERLACHHRKQEWRTCPCSFCAMKRLATQEIADATPVYKRPYMAYDGVVVLDRRAVAKTKWRALMNEEFEK